MKIQFSGKSNNLFEQYHIDISIRYKVTFFTVQVVYEHDSYGDIRGHQTKKWSQSLPRVNFPHWVYIHVYSANSPNITYRNFCCYEAYLYSVCLIPYVCTLLWLLKIDVPKCTYFLSWMFGFRGGWVDQQKSECCSDLQRSDL